MFTDYYGLSFNPFDKQCQKEKECFQSNDFRQMSSRLSYVRDVRGIGVFTAQRRQKDLPMPGWAVKTPMPLTSRT